MRVKKQYLELCMEQVIGLRLSKEQNSVVCCRPIYFDLYAEHTMRSAGLDELQTGNKIGRRSINNLQYVNNTTLMAESKKKLSSLLMRVKE